MLRTMSIHLEEARFLRLVAHALARSWTERQVAENSHPASSTGPVVAITVSTSLFFDFHVLE
jgi:hypothetical protein